MQWEGVRCPAMHTVIYLRHEGAVSTVYSTYSSIWLHRNFWYCRFGLATKSRLPCRLVGCDPSNRDGYGVNSEDVHALGSNILEFGFSWGEVARAVCIEQEPSKSDIHEFNAALASSNLALAPVTDGSIRYGSLSCSHTNMFLRCVAAGVASTHVDMSFNGRLDVDHLAKKDKAFAMAVKDGLVWSVLSYKVRGMFPGFVDMMQSARNVGSHIARAEHEVQVLLRIQTLASSQTRSHGEPNWQQITLAVLKTKPPCAADVKHLQVFVARCGGGLTGQFLKDLAEFHRQCVAERCIRGPFFLAVAELPLAEDVPYFKIAVIKAQYKCPEKGVKNKECLWITPSDLAKAVKERASAVLLAESVLRLVRLDLTTAGWGDKVPAATCISLLGKLDCLMCRFVLEKQDKAVLDAQAVGDVVHFVFKVGACRCISGSVSVRPSKADHHSWEHFVCTRRAHVLVWRSAASRLPQFICWGLAPAFRFLIPVWRVRLDNAPSDTAGCCGEASTDGGLCCGGADPVASDGGHEGRQCFGIVGGRAEVV